MFTTAQKDNSKSQYFPGNKMPVPEPEKDEIVDKPPKVDNSNEPSFAGSQGALYEKLKTQNQHLEQQLEALKVQLQHLLEKQKEAKKNPAPSLAGTQRGEFLGDEKLQKMQNELNSVYKEIEYFRKETKLLQISHKDVKYVDKYRDAENKISALQVDFKMLEIEKKTLEKTVKEKNKLLGELQFIRDHASHRDDGAPPVEEEFKELRFKLKEAYKREQLLEKEAQRRNQHILKVLAESTRIKDLLRVLSAKTGYDPVDGRIKAENAPFVYAADKRQNKSLARGGESDITHTGRLDRNEDNFDKLKDEVKELKQITAKKQKAFKLQSSKYNERLKELDEIRLETTKSITATDKECVIIRNKAREIYRALLENGMVPPGRDYEEILRDHQPRSPIIARKREIASRSASADGSTAGNLTIDTIKVRSMKGDNRSGNILPRLKKPAPQMSRINIGAGSRSALTKKAGDSLSRSPIGRISPSPKNQTATTRSPRGQVPIVLPGRRNVEDQQKAAIMKSKGFRMDEVGYKGDKQSEEFSDYNEIGQQKVKITLVRVWYDVEGIAGIYAEYMTEDGKKLQGVENIKENSGYKTAEFVATDGDYLGQISGYVNNEENCVESLTFVSNEGVTTSVGKAKKTSKTFKFDINDFEYPSMLYGCVKSRNKNEGSTLCKLGVLIASQEVEENIGAKEEVNKNRPTQALKRVVMR